MAFLALELTGLTKLHTKINSDQGLVRRMIIIMAYQKKKKQYHELSGTPTNQTIKVYRSGYCLLAAIDNMSMNKLALLQTTDV